MKVAALIIAAAALTACGVAGAPGSSEATPHPQSRIAHLGAPQITLRNPIPAARAWLFLSTATRPGGVVIIGIDDIALRTRDHRALPGTLTLAREAMQWGRSVLYLTANPDATAVRRDLARAGYPTGPVWTPSTAPWCGRHTSDAQFRVSCIAYAARRRDVILWLTRGRQLPNAADRTFAFPN